MSPLGFILASAALVCAAPEARDTRPRARTPAGPSTYCGQGYRCRGSGREMRCHPDAACDDRELRSGPCAVAAACLEKCVADPGGEACDMPCHGAPLRPRTTEASPAPLKVAYFLNHRKVAGTSMLVALKRVAGRVGLDGGSLLVAKEDLRPFNPNLFCKPETSAGVLYVTVLRHPLHRLVSLFHNENNLGERNPAANRNASAWKAFLDGACARHSGHRLCGNQIYGAFVAESTSTPSTRHLLDGVAMSVPHRSTRTISGAPDTLVISTGHRCAAPNYYARRLLGFARVTKAPADCKPKGLQGRASEQCDVAAPGTCAEPTFHPRWLHVVDQAAARQIDCCNAFAEGKTRRGRIGFAFACDCGRGAGRALSDLTSDVGIAVSSSEVAFQVAKRVLDGFTSVWKSTSELDYVASMAWGARNLISAQVRLRRGAGAHGRARGAETLPTPRHDRDVPTPPHKGRRQRRLQQTRRGHADLHPRSDPAGTRRGRAPPRLARGA